MGEFDAEQAALIADTDHVVHATFEERHQLWLEHSWRPAWDEPAAWLALKWEPVAIGKTSHVCDVLVSLPHAGGGWELPKVCPISCSMWWFRIGGKLVAFWRGEGQVTHYHLTESWVEGTFAHVRRKHGVFTNAANFGHVLDAIVRQREAKP